MPVKRHFIGWSAPVTAGVCRFLLPDRLAGPVDLSGQLIVVPTRQAGRRLRESLALFCARQGTALLSARVVPPSFLFMPPGGAVPGAPDSLIRALWAEVLLGIDPAEYPGFFTSPKTERDFAWALDTGDMIQRLREETADGGCRIADVVRRCGETFEEPERWNDLARMEALYLERLTRMGMEDPCALRIRQAEAPEQAEELRRMVVAAVPDPSPLALTALQAIARRVPVDILIHAPPSLEGAFDEWGRPLPAHWKSVPIDIPAAGDNLVPAGSPESQSRHVVRLIASEAHRFGPADVAVGAPDSAVVADLETTLAEHGLPAFDPSGRPLTDHAIYRLIEGFAVLARDRTYAALSAVVRHPDVLAWLCDVAKASSLDLLTQLDEFQNEYLPMTIDDVVAGTVAAGNKPAFAELGAAVSLVAGELDRFRTAVSAGAGLRAFLQRVFETRRVDARNPADVEFRAAASVVDAGLHELDAAAASLDGLSRGDGLLTLLRHLAIQTYACERDDSVIDLEGWLELPWNDAPFLIVTGMNEGVVPDSRLGDVFLPDSLRVRLGLRDDASRFARDAYLMAALIASRRDAGRVCFIAGRTSREGDPLRPSRLLFRCRDEELPGRALRMFGPVADAQPNPPATISFRLDARPPADVPEDATRLTRLSVTALRDYLACPFRFYLKHVLGMEELDDSKSGLDALDFGNLAHFALQELGNNARMRGSADAAAVGEFLVREAERWVTERYGPAPALPVQVGLDAARQRLAAAAAVHARLVVDGWETILIERKYRMELGGLTLSGKIDRVDRHRKSGALRLIDYKTSDAAVTPEKAHLGSAAEATPAFARVRAGGKDLRWVDLQLPLYRLLLAAGEGLAGPVEVAYFNLPKAVMETDLHVWEDFDEPLLGSAEACARAVAESIRARVFWPPSERLRYDDFATLFFTTMEECVDRPFGP